MTVNAASWISTSGTEHTSARDSRADFDRAADDFAGVFANAVQSAAPKPEPKKPEGTSELDRPEEPAQEADSDDKKVKRARGHSTAADVSDASETAAVVQSAMSLDPELQAKLTRVMQRMREETGHDVTVTETYRSQDRQNTLFAQGRETPGPVVTWTRNSKHTQGRAVDVTLDGGAAGFDAYTALQRIANEEGLRTLGARDPGHLELPSTVQPTDATPIPAEPADATGPGQVSIARLASVAQVAQVSVARPAEVARVASVARPDGAQPIAAIARGQNVAPTQNNGAVRAEQTVQPTNGDVASVARRSKEDTADAGSGSESNGGGSNTRGEHRGGYGALAAAVALRDASPSHAASPMQAVANTAHVNPAEHAAQIIAAYQDAPARPLSQIIMSVDAGNGVTDKVQVAMRGSSLNAAIDAGDARGAQAMNARADDLVRALTRDGIDVESLRVRAAASTTTVATVTGSSQTANTSTDNHSRSERNNNPWQQQDRQRSQDDRRQQQRNQRGGRDQ